MIGPRSEIRKRVMDRALVRYIGVLLRTARRRLMGERAARREAAFAQIDVLRHRVPVATFDREWQREAFGDDPPKHTYGLDGWQRIWDRRRRLLVAVGLIAQ